jgi:nitrogen fixation protein FixH
MWVPVGLLTMSVTIGGIMVYFATNDPSFAVEEDYYQKGLNWDQTMAQKRVNQELGWKVRPSVVDGQLQVKVTDATDVPVAGGQLEYIVFHNARAGQRLKGEALDGQDSAGIYTADIDFDRAGTWVVRYRIQRGEDLYVSESRMELN